MSKRSIQSADDEFSDSEFDQPTSFKKLKLTEQYLSNELESAATAVTYNKYNQYDDEDEFSDEEMPKFEYKSKYKKNEKESSSDFLEKINFNQYIDFNQGSGGNLFYDDDELDDSASLMLDVDHLSNGDEIKIIENDDIDNIVEIPLTANPDTLLKSVPSSQKESEQTAPKPVRLVNSYRQRLLAQQRARNADNLFEATNLEDYVQFDEEQEEESSGSSSGDDELIQQQIINKKIPFYYYFNRNNRKSNFKINNIINKRSLRSGKIRQMLY